MAELSRQVDSELASTASRKLSIADRSIETKSESSRSSMPSSTPPNNLDVATLGPISSPNRAFQSPNTPPWRTRNRGSSESSRRNVVYNDPDYDPLLPCVGGISFLKVKEKCIYKDLRGAPYRSWSTNIMGKPRDGPMRDLGWGHPVVVLRWFEEDDNLMLDIVNITSFDMLPFHEYLQHRRDYYSGVDQSANIKYANTLPIFHQRPGQQVGYSPKQFFEAQFLFTTGVGLSKQCYVALEGIYTVPWQYLRAYGVRYPRSWDVRLNRTSYDSLMLKFAENKYESQEYEENVDLNRRHKNLYGRNSDSTAGWERSSRSSNALTFSSASAQGSPSPLSLTADPFSGKLTVEANRPEVVDNPTSSAMNSGNSQDIPQLVSRLKPSATAFVPSTDKQKPSK